MWLETVRKRRLQRWARPGQVGLYPHRKEVGPYPRTMRASEDGNAGQRMVRLDTSFQKTLTPAIPQLLWGIRRELRADIKAQRENGG